MKFLWISALWLSCMLTAAARDPFAEPTPLCASPAVSVMQWRLSGMIGRGNDYIGWLRSTQGQIVAVAHDRPLPFAGWRIEELSPFRLTLSSLPGCMPQRVTLQLKGK